MKTRTILAAVTLIAMSAAIRHVRGAQVTDTERQAAKPSAFQTGMTAADMGSGATHPTFGLVLREHPGESIRALLDEIVDPSAAAYSLV